MGNEWFWVVIVALFLFGPKHLPQIARWWVRFSSEMRRAYNDVQDEIHRAADEAEGDSSPELLVRKAEGTIPQADNTPAQDKKGPDSVESGPEVERGSSV